MKDFIFCLLLIAFGTVVSYGIFEGLQNINQINLKRFIISFTGSIISVLWIYFKVLKRHKTK